MSSTARLASVTSVNPYQVQLLGESTPLNLAPLVLATVNVGDYVWVDFYDQQLVVLGRIQDGSVPQLGSTEDLNAFVYTGVWNQPLSANTSTPHNYPQLTAGLLEVFRAQPSGTMVHQRYTTYNSGNAGAVWWRSYYNGTWEPWVQIGASEPQWTAMTLGNGWSNYGSGYAPAQYTKINGIVHIEGLIKSGTPGSSGFFTMPVGYRPSGHLQWTSMSSGGVADIRVFSTGAVCVYALVSGSNASVSISVNYPADQ